MFLPLLIPLLGLLTGWLTATPKPDKTVKTDFQQMVAAEVTFAAYGSQHSVQDAFGKFLSRAWMFSEGQFQTGATLYANQPEKPGRLLWRPIHAGIAASGDLGFTTGPWEFHPVSTDDKPVAFGDFVTLWQKNSAGDWEAIYDGGVSHAAYVKPTKAVWPTNYPAKLQTSTDTARLRQTLLATEAAFAQRARLSLRQAYKPVLGATEDLRLLREGQLPYIGNGARALIETSPRPAQFSLLRSGISAAGDLGYTLGYQESTPKRGFYLHVWRLTDAKWLLILEVLSPNPAG
ncbi:hypothetical protein [Hymenobacter guriensis]|uniref:Nuclear transport factor 2 family protein n=1 Tax=Hymenobacter guriensis TaxID=2793065 RepID=A0ABS0KYP7_9BACT|nr:hypothetical protein [Hymenobacter guriensis]MBG8552997.1 hypothetical protein [Hymenobacter guriensis]